MELSEIRQEIDKLDVQIQKLFEERMERCMDVAVYKKEHGMQVFQAGRESQVLQKVEDRAKPGLEKASRTMFAEMMSISSQLQQKRLSSSDKQPELSTPNMEQATRIAAQGMEGANSHVAAMNFFPGKDVKFYPTFEDVFRAVENSDVEYGVLPIYNSTNGVVTQTVDLMMNHQFYITATYAVSVRHCLCAIPGAKIEDIKVAFSHPQALSQCSEFMDYHNIGRQNYSNTATSAKYVADQQDPTIAAICSEDAAQRNGLVVLASGISNVVPNYTQFVCITRNLEVSEDADIVSVMLTIPNEPGSLSRILNKFFLYGLDMTKLESRPIKNGSFDVVFHIDFKGNLRDRQIAIFLNDLSCSCKEFKLLGNSKEI